MNTRMLLVLSLAGLMFSCDLKKVEISQRTLDSLRTQLEINRQMNESLLEIGTWIDSIDANREMIRTRMLEGAGTESYVARLRDINEYVDKTEKKLKALQRTAKKSNNGALNAAIRKMKADLDVRNHELTALKEQIILYQKQNDELIQTVSLQKTELAEKVNQLKSTQAATQQLEGQVSQLLTKSKIDQGEALFAQALAVEETANRTRFAPRKKRNTRKRALELYTLALSYGKDEAKEKIAALEKKL